MSEDPYWITTARRVDLGGGLSFIRYERVHCSEGRWCSPCERIRSVDCTMPAVPDYPLRLLLDQPKKDCDVAQPSKARLMAGR
jgi:hypothetical protein